MEIKQKVQKIKLANFDPLSDDGNNIGSSMLHSSLIEDDVDPSSISVAPTNRLSFGKSTRIDSDDKDGEDNLAADLDSDDEVDNTKKSTNMKRKVIAPEGASKAVFNEPLVFDVKISQVNDLENCFQYLNDGNAKKKDIWEYVVDNMYSFLACITMDDTFNKNKTDRIKYYGLVNTAFLLIQG